MKENLVFSEELNGLRQTLRRLGVKPSKSRGQNFLFCPSALQNIIEFGKPREGETFIEVGPGLGALTSELLHFGHVVAIEVESAFADFLEQQHPQLELIREDARHVDLSQFEGELVVFANLPYSLSSDLIFWLLSFHRELKRAVLLLQSEFVQRLGARPGTKAYGALSVGCQLFSDVRIGPLVPPESFYPAPGVDSRVVELRFLKESRYPVVNSYFLTSLTKTIFSHRRQKLSNALNHFPSARGLVVSQLLDELNISPSLRPEQLSIEQIVQLANQIARSVPDLCHS
jgi:16S rRNA (adenine1518-N6/adenine1519-N6)-dimethyltransferase